MNLTWTFSAFGLFAVAAANDASAEFLSSWMGQLGDILANQTFLDLTLPGTHDTMTYDLSETVSEGGIDDEPWLSAILNSFGHLGGIGAFIKTQAQTQGLNITQQLDAGIRFLDFRIMYTSGDWHCLHMVQSNQKALTYLQHVRKWLDSHPTEIIAIWLSKHGSQCKTGDAQYPGVPTAAKHLFWQQMVDLFGGLLLDTSQSTLNGTTIAELVKRSHRVIVFAADFLEFTGGTTLATDACLVDNQLVMSDVYEEDLKSDLTYFANISVARAIDKKEGKLLLLSMANSPPSAAIKYAAEIEWLPGGTSNIGACASTFNIPGMSQWCPETLLDVGQLTAYYKQLTIDAAFVAGYEFPNAIYIDAVAPGGLIRTGTQKLSAGDDSIVCNIYSWTSCQSHQPKCDANWTADGEKAHWDCYDYDGNKHGFCGLAWQNHYKCCRDADRSHAIDGYAYVDTLIAYNVRRICSNSSGKSPSNCKSMTAVLEKRRAQFPLTVWSDSMNGRLTGWPDMDRLIFV